MSKKQNNTVVQSSEDFAKVARRLLEKTSVFHMSQAEIDEQVQTVISWENVEAYPGIQKIYLARCSENGEIELFKHAQAASAPQNGEAATISAISVPPSTVSDLVVGDWCVVLFGNEEFPGQVPQVVNGRYEVTVMRYEVTVDVESISCGPHLRMYIFMSQILF